MAKFDTENEQITSKEQAQAIERKKKLEKGKTAPKKTIDKGKAIVFSVIGLVAISIVGGLIYSMKGDEKEKGVTEISAPESEADKYNSKLQAIEQQDKQDPNRKVELTETFKEDEKQKESEEQQKKLEEQINNMGKEQNPQPSAPQRESQYSSPVPPPRRTRNTGGTGSGTSNRTSPIFEHGTLPPPQQNTYEEEREKPIKNTSPVKEESGVNSNNGNGFFKNNKKASTKAEEVVLFACIHTDQKIVDGNRVKMRLTKSVIIDGNNFPVNTILYGTAKINPNRLMVEINKINQTDVKLEIFDAEDSNAGIYVETPNLNALVRKEFKKDALDEKELEKIPFSKTLKSLFQKKAKEENIELLNNYKIIIKYKKNEN